MLDSPQDSTPAKPVRPGRRIIRTGVYVGVVGFVVTAVGAFMLGQGPGQLEVPGGVIHRIGMVGMLGGFLVVLLGYRWPQLQSALTTISDISVSAPPPLRRPDLNQLLDQVGPDVPPPAAAPVMAEAIESSELGRTSPRAIEAREVTRESLRESTQRHTSASHAMPAAFDSESHPREVRTTKRGMSPSKASVTLVITGWTMLGLASFFGLLLYLLASRGTSHVVMTIGEFAVAISLLVVAVHSRGGWRTFAIGAFVPTATMLFIHVMIMTPFFIYGMGMGMPWGPGGGMPGMAGMTPFGTEEVLWRMASLMFRVLALGACGVLALFVRLTLQMLGA